MDEKAAVNTTIHISSKAHLNLTFNLLQCGNNEILPEGFLSINSEDIFTLVYINHGAAMLESNGLAYKIAQGHGFFAFNDWQYTLQNAEPEIMSVTWLSFSGYQVENYLNRANITRSRPIFADEEGAVAQLLSQLYAAAHRLPNRYCRMAAGLYQIFSYLLDANPTKQIGNHVDSADFFAVKAVDYIERNYMKNISVEEIATALGISRKHLYSVFSSVLSVAPKQYLILYRIEKACIRLKTTNQSVMEVSESVGYSNQFYFAKEFKRLTGITPTEYRKNPLEYGRGGDLFSYRTFVPTLRARLSDNALHLPMEENILSVYSPPMPIERQPTSHTKGR